MFVRAANESRLDPRMLAVAPLAIGVPGLDSGESAAIARAMLTRLDSGGTVRTVSAEDAERAWDGQAAPAAAAVQLAQRTGAGLVVLAQLWSAGRDSVRLEARLLDVAGNTVWARYEIRAARDELAAARGRLGDSLAVLIRHDLTRRRPSPGPARGGPEGAAIGPTPRRPSGARRATALFPW